MGSVYEDLDGHEGYAMRRLPDGTMTGSWTPETAVFSAYVAACECDWRGRDHAPTEEGHEEAIDEWDRRHAQPLLAQAVPRNVRRLVREVKQILEDLVDERPAAGVKAIREVAAVGECHRSPSVGCRGGSSGPSQRGPARPTSASFVTAVDRSSLSPRSASATAIGLAHVLVLRASANDLGTAVAEDESSASSRCRPTHPFRCSDIARHLRVVPGGQARLFRPRHRSRRPERSSLGQPPPDRQRLVPIVVPQERLRASWHRTHGQDDHPPNRHDGRGGGAGQPMGARV